MNRHVRGAITLEYSVLIGTIALASAGALVGVGVALLNNFDFVRSFLLSPFP